MFRETGGVSVDAHEVQDAGKVLGWISDQIRIRDDADLIWKHFCRKLPAKIMLKVGFEVVAKEKFFR